MNPGRKQEHGIWQWGAPVLACVISQGQFSFPKHHPKDLHDFFLHPMNLLYILCMSIAPPVSSCAPVTAIVNSAATAQGAKENNGFVFGNNQNFKSFGFRDFVLTVWIPNP